MVSNVYYWAYLLAGLLAFWNLPDRMRPGLMLALSLGWLGYHAPNQTLLLGLGATGTWAILRGFRDREGRSPLLVLAVGLAVILGALKFRPLIAPDVPYAEMIASGFIPLGFSYLAFRAIHVLIEVRRKQLPVPSLILFLGYLFFLPAYTAGPIDRLNRFALPSGRVNSADLYSGIERIAVGVIKKFVFAEGLLLMAASTPSLKSALIADHSESSTALFWTATSIAYLRIYLDFAAYSDIALGTARLFGVTLMENFNAPILATNPSDFWRRWHISLSTWCQHYVYMPAIGWLRNPYIPLTVSFLAMGLWHWVTLNRVGWALYNAGGVAGYMLWNRWMNRVRPGPWRRSPFWVAPAWLGTQAFVCGSIVFFMNGEDQSLGDSLKLLGRLVGIR